MAQSDWEQGTCSMSLYTVTTSQEKTRIPTPPPCQFSNQSRLPCPKSLDLNLHSLSCNFHGQSVMSKVVVDGRWEGSEAHGTQYAGLYTSWNRKWLHVKTSHCTDSFATLVIGLIVKTIGIGRKNCCSCKVILMWQSVFVVLKHPPRVHTIFITAIVSNIKWLHIYRGGKTPVCNALIGLSFAIVGLSLQ